MPTATLTFNGSSKSILIVDDDGVIVDLLSVMFEKHDFKVFKAENGLDGWNLFKNKNIRAGRLTRACLISASMLPISRCLMFRGERPSKFRPSDFA